MSIVLMLPSCRWTITRLLLMAASRVFSRFAVIQSAKLHTKPNASNLLSFYLKHKDYPDLIAFAVLKKDVKDDHFARSYFNWNVEGINFCVLRTGCYPFVKYHCTKSPALDLTLQNNFFTFLKIINLGSVFLNYKLIDD